MKTTGLSFAVLALIGDTQAVKDARFRHNYKAKSMTADEMNYAD